MAGIQEKIQLLLRIAHRLNEAHVEWALGASMLLYFKGITSDFHDIDLMVADRDAECVRTILSEMGESCPSDLTPNPMYRTKIPIFTLGKYYEEDGKILLPLAVQVHHAVCDGFHICRFVNELQELING